ncbi:MAG: hypothetical protein GF384_03350, partial [Elusimicrobia bacterium]|nr:hypothetical protein [Elusimicrobiota bacterium]MBD3411954.1 hypothetical protein [Elusimicrobiota bacterium]
IDIGIAGEHLALQAAELGLGTCWLGWFNEKAVKKELSMPRHKKIDVIISLGYPADTEHKELKRRALDEICTYNPSPNVSLHTKKKKEVIPS